MEYIAEAARIHPEITAYFNLNISSIPANLDKPFTGSEEFIDFMEGYVSYKGESVSNGHNYYRSVGRVRGNAEVITDLRKKFAALKYVAAKLKKAVYAKTELMERKPFFFRFCEKMEMSDKEVDVMMHILMASSTRSVIGLTDPLQMVGYSDMTVADIFNFLSPRRKHMKQNIFEYFQEEYILSNSLVLNSETAKLLLDVPLTSDQLLKINGTALEELLNEGPGGEGSEEGAVEEGEGLVDPLSIEEDQREESEEEEMEDVDGYDDFREFMKREVELEKEMVMPENGDIDRDEKNKEDEDDEEPTPYTSELAYLETECKAIFYLFKVKEMEVNVHSIMLNPSGKDSSALIRLREFKGNYKLWKAKCEKRLQLTKEAGTWIPRVERIIQSRKLDDFEKSILITLIGYHLYPDFKNLAMGLNVGAILRTFCGSLKEQIDNRKYFYKSAHLIKDGIVNISDSANFEIDLNEARLTIDRRMLEFSMGLDSEFGELVEGSHLYRPTVKLEKVILPAEQKRLILDTVTTYEDFRKARKNTGFDRVIGYGGGITILFYGESGTGKTMMANAVGTHLDKRILLINFPSLGTMSSDHNMKLIFREAKINDAILFFDECESIFESRSSGNLGLNLLLTEIERHDGLIILATNRAFDLDEAMHRRITLAIEFSKPDHLLREQIWANTFPPKMKLKDDVDTKVLALNYELTGGFIKNAILSSLSVAVSRAQESENPKEIVIGQEDLVAGAKLQLRGRLRMTSFHRRIIPKHELSELVLPDEQMSTLRDILSFDKAQQVLYSQWGFGKMISRDKGITCLFYGKPGTGKSLAAEAIAYSAGKPLRIVNTAEVISKYVGETGKNIQAVFEEAQSNDVVLVFDEAEGLFSARHGGSGTSTERYADMDVGLLLYHMEHFNGIVILCTNLISSVDTAFFRRIKFVLEFPVPNAAQRKKLWMNIIPKECPKDNISFDLLANRFEITGGTIRSAIIRAAARVALREDTRVMQTQDLLSAVAMEVSKDSDGASKNIYV